MIVASVFGTHFGGLQFGKCGEMQSKLPDVRNAVPLM